MNEMDCGLNNELLLSQKSYPGRGIVVGVSSSGDKIYQLYWIMGRSHNSKNRHFIRDGEYVKSCLFNDDPKADTSLIVYYPMKNVGRVHIVSNGDQTDTIFECLNSGKTFFDAAEMRTFEPDPPNFTPRISSICSFDGIAKFEFSIVKSLGNDPLRRMVSLYKYENPKPGSGYCITTYVDDGDPLRSFIGEPFQVDIGGNESAALDKFWSYLNPDFRVSICLKSINCVTGGVDIIIKNRNS